MTSIFAALILGFVLSKLVPFSPRIQKFIDKLGTVAIMILLFTMGIAIGANPQMMANLPSLGLKAILFAVVTVIGSTVAVWMVNRLAKGGSFDD